MLAPRDQAGAATAEVETLFDGDPLGVLLRNVRFVGVDPATLTGVDGRDGVALVKSTAGPTKVVGCAVETTFFGARRITNLNFERVDAADCCGSTIVPKATGASCTIRCVAGTTGRREAELVGSSNTRLVADDSLHDCPMLAHLFHSLLLLQTQSFQCSQEVKSPLLSVPFLPQIE